MHVTDMLRAMDVTNHTCDFEEIIPNRQPYEMRLCSATIMASDGIVGPRLSAQFLFQFLFLRLFNIAHCIMWLK